MDPLTVPDADGHIDNSFKRAAEIRFVTTRHSCLDVGVPRPWRFLASGVYSDRTRSI